jgi:integrase/recombinase XerD
MNAPLMPPLDPLIEGYLSYLDKVSRRTPRTIVDVRCTLRRAVAGLAHRRPGVDLWRLSLEDYLHWLEAERQRGRTDACLAKYLSHVRGLLDYAWRSGRAERNVLDGFSLQHPVKKTAPQSLTLEEAECLVQATAGAGPTARRDRLIVLLLYGCGLRTSELCGLNVADINRERHELVVQKAKGDRPRTVPIPEALYTEVLAHLLEHGKRGALFRTHFLSRRITAKDVCEVVTATATRAGLRAGVTARTLRHSFATHLMDRGVDLAIIASLMGHRSPHETGVYLHVLPQRPEAAVRTLPIGEPS